MVDHGPLELEVLRWANGGDGVAIPDAGPLAGRVVFVPGAVPGDRVRARVVKRGKRWARTAIVEVLEPSPERREPPCPAQGRCGGCPWMVGTRAVQRTAREVILRAEAGKVLGWSEAELDARVSLASEAGPELGYRGRLRLAWRRTPAGRVELGFRRAGSHGIEPVDGCPIAVPALNEAWEQARAAASATGGGWGEVHLLAGADGVAGVARSDGGASRPFGAERVSVQIGEATLRLGPEAFCQANAAEAGAMAATVEAWASAAREAGSHAVELFAGSGTFTVPLLQAGFEVDAYEVAPVGEPFEETTSGHGVARFHRCDLAKVGVPLPAPPEPPALVLLDPPRAGAAAIMPWVAACAAATVIMVSCDIATGLRDLRVLQDAGYTVRHVVGHDMFPHTGHQELLALAKR